MTYAYFFTHGQDTTFLVSCNKKPLTLDQLQANYGLETGSKLLAHIPADSELVVMAKGLLGMSKKQSGVPMLQIDNENELRLRLTAT